MRTTLNIDQDALLAAKNMAQRERVSLGDAVSVLIRLGASGGAIGARTRATQPLNGRFALLSARNELITPQHVRDLMEREGV